MSTKTRAVTMSKATGRWTVIALFLILVISVCYFAYGFISISRWDPLDFKNPQKVNNAMGQISYNDVGVPANTTYPIVKINPSGDTIVSITGTKCNLTDLTVDTQTQTFYEFLLPEDVLIPTVQGDSKLTPGCVTRTFENKVPQDVVNKAKFYLANNQPVVMHIQGNQTPIDSNSKPGVTEKWQTQDFALVM